MANPWIGTLRMRTLPAAASPVILGIAYAASIDGFVVLPAIAALVGALLLQIGTNLANDYYDYVQGADTADRAGPARASATGALNPLAVRNAAFAAFALAALVGLYLVIRGGWPILLIGVTGILSGIFYTKGSKSIAYVGLGELFCFAFFGPIAVAGTVYVQTLTWEPFAIAWGVPLGLLTAAILVVNNLRDIPTDKAAGKRTLAVRIGQVPTIWLWAIFVGGATLSPFIIAHFADEIWWLLPVAAGLLAIGPWKAVSCEHDSRSAYNPALGGTARILLAFSVLASLGVLL